LTTRGFGTDDFEQVATSRTPPGLTLTRNSLYYLDFYCGVRIGTPALTTHGFGLDDFEQAATTL